jgi:poly-gamma-glutamate capsule biosynthesis protein CapA/YwtB (metallophosphatase superfamily)
VNAARRLQLRGIGFEAIREKISELETLIEDAKNTAESVRDEEQEALDNMPESLQQAERGEAMQHAIEQLDALVDALEDTDMASVSSALTEFEENFEW